MMSFDVTVVDVPVAVTTVIDLQETNTKERTFVFHNLQAVGGDTLSVLIQHSSDGGATWTTAVASFDIDPGEVIVKQVSTSYLSRLRIRASGGGDSRDLEIGILKVYPTDGSPQVHVTPIA